MHDRTEGTQLRVALPFVNVGNHLGSVTRRVALRRVVKIKIISDPRQAGIVKGIKISVRVQWSHINEAELSSGIVVRTKAVQSNRARRARRPQEANRR